MSQGPDWAEASTGPVQFGSVLGADPLADRQAVWRDHFAKELYGPVPPPPDTLEVHVEPLAGERARRIILTMNVGDRRFEVDAALWLPDGDGPWPMIAGLSFLGPMGVLAGNAFPLDEVARVYSHSDWGVDDGGLHDRLRGKEAHRWPVQRLNDAGYGVLVSCYGSWAPDDPAAITTHGAKPFLGCETGAISLWAWALMRLVDVADHLSELNGLVAVAGHSRLGKAALWAGVHDTRIGTVFANNAGCGGTAPAAHGVGETLSEMSQTFPHWIPSWDGSLGLDQHHLMACLAPRRLYVASARNDTWADPIGTYLALQAASPAWEALGRWPEAKALWGGRETQAHTSLGHHIRPGDHEMLTEDWDGFMTFIKDNQSLNNP